MLPARAVPVKQKQLRTCLGCGIKLQQHELCGFVRRPNGLVVEDNDRRVAGRHVYCCRTAVCMARFIKNKKRIARAFRSETVQFDEGLRNLFGSVE